MNSPCVNCGADLRVCKECDWYNGVWISKDQYETKLKDDMISMLEEFDLKLSEYEDADLIRVEYIRQDIQERINDLKPESEVKENDN